MNASQIYILIAIIVLAIIAIIIILRRKKERKLLSKLAMFAFLLIIFGIVFVDQGRLISYSFMGAAVILAIIDIIKQSKNKKKA
jgi:uncharacterized membrane protein